MSQRLFGIHAAGAALEHGPERVRRAWLDSKRRDRRLEALRVRLQELGIALEFCERRVLARLAGSPHHQGIVLDVVLPAARGEAELEQAIAGSDKPLFVVLDQVQDPHNLGAVLRSCDAVGAAGVVVPRDRAVGLTAVVCKVASGAAETVPLFRVTNLARILDRLKEAGLWLYGASGEAPRSVFETDLAGPVALVLGAEGGGLRRLTREKCDTLVSLPLRGRVESLNLAVAAGVLLYETLRQREYRR